MKIAKLHNRLVDLLKPEFLEWEKVSGVSVSSFKVSGYNEKGKILGTFYINKPVVSNKTHLRIIPHDEDTLLPGLKIFRGEYL